MNDDIKQELKKTKEALGDLIDAIEDKAEDFSEDVAETWNKAKVQMVKTRGHLAESLRKQEASLEKLDLQAHLGIMEARDHWNKFHEDISDLVHHVTNRSHTAFDYARVQANLAKMEARDFIEKAEPEIEKDFHQSKEKAEKLSKSAVMEVRKIAESLRKRFED